MRVHRTESRFVGPFKWNSGRAQRELSDRGVRTRGIRRLLNYSPRIETSENRRDLTDHLGVGPVFESSRAERPVRIRVNDYQTVFGRTATAEIFAVSSKQEIQRLF